MKRIYQSVIYVLALLLMTSTYAQAAEAPESANIILANEKEVVNVGEDIKYEMYFRVLGMDQVYEQMTLTFDMSDLLENPSISFKQDLNELRVFGVLPQFNKEKGILVWVFNDLKGGAETNKVISLNTTNGELPTKDKYHAKLSLKSNSFKPLQTEAETILVSNPSTSSTNYYMGNFENGVINKIYTLRYGDESVFGMGIAVNKSTSGSLMLQPGSKVKYQVTLPDGFKYVSDTSDATPTVKGQVITWEFDHNNGASDDFYFSQLFNLHISMTQELKYYEKVILESKAELTFANGEQQTLTGKSTTMITPNQEQDKPISSAAGVLAATLKGPIDGYGNTGDSGNADAEVHENSLVGWTAVITPLTANEETRRIHQLDYFYTPDKNTQLEEFYSGDFYYRPNNKFSNYQTLEGVYYSFSVYYEGDSEWTHLVPVIELSTLYTAEELGIDPNKKIESIWLHFHDNKVENQFLSKVGYFSTSPSNQTPAGTYSPNVKFYHSIKKGFRGTLKADLGAFAHGFKDGILRTDYTGILPSYGFDPATNNALGGAFDKYLVNKTAKVIDTPEGTSRIVQARVSMNDGLNNIVSNEEKNIINFTIRNDKSSLNVLEGPLVSYVLIEDGFVLDKMDQATGGKVELIEENYANSSQHLLKLTYNNQVLRPNSTATISFEVGIQQKASYKLNVKSMNYFDGDFEVFKTENSDGTFTSKETEKFDFNRNGVQDVVYSTSKNFTYRNQYEFYGQNLIAANDGDYSEYKNVHPDQDLTLEMTLGNPEEKAVSSFTLVNVLPTVGDTYVVNDVERESQFTLTLDEFIEVDPALYEVYYSKTDEPVLKDFLDRNQNSKLPDSILTDLVDKDQEWLRADQVDDLAEIRSFAIVKTESSRSLYNEEIKFFADLHIESDINDLETEISDRVAYNTFAFAMNDSSVLEVSETHVILGDSTESKYTVDFDSHGGSEVKSIKDITANSIIDQPENPSRDGYRFIAWYLDENYTNKFDFNSMRITSDLTLHAQWEKIDSDGEGTTPTDPNNPSQPVPDDKDKPGHGTLPSTGVSADSIKYVVILGFILVLVGHQILKRSRSEEV